MAPATVHLFTPEGAAHGPVWSCFPTPAACAKPSDDMAAKLAGYGYAVLLPDVYYRTGELGPVRHGQRVRRQK